MEKIKTKLIRVFNLENFVGGIDPTTGQQRMPEQSKLFFAGTIQTEQKEFSPFAGLCWIPIMEAAN